MGDAFKDDGSSQEKVVRKEKRALLFRKWTRTDVVRASAVLVVHLLCLLAPFTYKWEAFQLGMILAVGHPIDWVSTHWFHHQFMDSDRDPHSPMEGFLFSHVFWIFDTGYMREKCGARNNEMDLKQQWFYRFLQKTIGLHILAFWTLVYYFGGLPYLTCGVVARTNNDGRELAAWHNNHHAFEASARSGMEWYQVDIVWYLIRFLQALGLATDVKLPSNAQKCKMAFAR